MMTIHSLRATARPDNLKNQMRASQSLARKLYLAAIVGSAAWIALLVFGPMAFMDADGMVVQSREVLMPPYNAQVVEVTVRTGDRVQAGQDIGRLVSTQMLDLISDLTNRKAQADARVEQVKARLAAIDLTLPVAEKRLGDADAAVAALDRATAHGFVTKVRAAEFARDRYDAAREVASLKAERVGLEGDQTVERGNRLRLADSLDAAQRTYRDGVIISPVAGTVGPRVVAPGTVLSPSDRIAEIHHGTKFVLAYLPTNRFYAAEPGQEVVVTDGVNRQTGHIERLEAITDQLPAEFQPNFSSVERQQIARIAIGDAEVFPLLSKIKVTSPMAPFNLVAQGRVALTDAAARGGAWISAQATRVAVEAARLAGEATRVVRTTVASAEPSPGGDLGVSPR